MMGLMVGVWVLLFVVGTIMAVKGAQMAEGPVGSKQSRTGQWLMAMGLVAAVAPMIAVVIQVAQLAAGR